MRKQFVIPMKMILKPEMTPISNNKVDDVSFTQKSMSTTTETLEHFGNTLNVEIDIDDTTGNESYTIDFSDEIKNETIETTTFTYGVYDFYGVFIEKTLETEIAFDMSSFSKSIKMLYELYYESNFSYLDPTTGWKKGHEKTVDVLFTNKTEENPKFMTPVYLGKYQNICYYKKINARKVYICLYLLYQKVQKSGVSYAERYNYSGDLSATIYKTENLTTQIGASKESYSIPESPFLNIETTYNGQEQARYIANSIISKYENGKETCQLEIVTGKYYNRDNELVFSQETSLMNVGDRFEIYDPRSKWENGFYPKVFEITTKEFSYKGVPRIILYGKEI